MAILTTTEYIETYGRLETIQLKPVDNHGGDVLDYEIDLTTQPYLVNAVRDANAFVSAYIDNVAHGAIFKRYAAKVARSYLRFNIDSKEASAELESLRESMRAFSNDIIELSSSSDGSFLVSEYFRSA